MRDKNRKVDLHLHSSCSDGVYTPQQLVQILSASGLAAFALTDHDTLDGLASAAKAAEENKVELVPGVEISVVEETREIHILGFYPVKLRMLGEKLAELRIQRFARMEKTVWLLQKLGFRITEAEVFDEAGQASPGRMHLARILVRKNYVHSIEEAFKLYLGFKKPAYVLRNTFSLADTINLLVDSQAIPVFAHPGAEGLKMLKSLIPLGLKGVEAFHPDHNHKMVLEAIRLATENNLLITGGSDFHGLSERYTQYPIEAAIDYIFFQKLRETAG